MPGLGLGPEPGASTEYLRPEAVVWISAITGLAASCFFLASLVVQARSWRAASPRSRVWLETSGVLFFLGAIFSHEVGAMLARRVGLGPPVVDALAHAYERWDGKGHPEGLEGERRPRRDRPFAGPSDSGH